ncbi:TldD/PmbA family protein [Ancylothrix sp. C2]|uniref:TldD/PmbA family protein n=1 Tax=Ancylothrix sp. D3o TaxID=2953691 RepID=UPI0021BA9B6E|nr:TldD/PmbA family protein [Ancylothrix sp. D3o]MCT7951968.1 TldD/PmbA family protein [Ancylothrix sp. D3o]
MIQQEVLPEELLELAAKSGAEAAEVFQSKSLSRPVFFEANRLKQLESAEAEGTALRLWHNGRPGLAVAYGPVAAQDLVNRAISLSHLNEPETIELNHAYECRYPDIGEGVAVQTLVNWGKEAISLVREKYPEVLCTAEWDCEIESTRLVNSLGLDCSHSDTTLSCFLSAEWVRGEDFLSVGDGQTERGNLEPATIAQNIIERLNWAKNNVNSPTGKVPVLFTAKAADMLWGTVTAALNGKMVIEKASPWSDRLGEAMISEKITLSQQPDSGPYSCPFDDEGTQTRNLVFIKNGVLQLFYADRSTGKLLGSGTTGNGFRPGLGSYPTPGLFNIVIEPGTGSLADLIAQMDEGIIVDQMLGGGAGISGEFSVNVDLGYRVKKGKIIGRVKDTMVAGNVYTALKQIVQLGGDGEWNGSCYTPSVIVEGLSVTGKT